MSAHFLFKHTAITQKQIHQIGSLFFSKSGTSVWCHVRLSCPSLALWLIAAEWTVSNTTTTTVLLLLCRSATRPRGRYASQPGLEAHVLGPSSRPGPSKWVTSSTRNLQYRRSYGKFVGESKKHHGHVLSCHRGGMSSPVQGLLKWYCCCRW